MGGGGVGLFSKPIVTSFMDSPLSKTKMYPFLKLGPSENPMKIFTTVMLSIYESFFTQSMEFFGLQVFVQVNELVNLFGLRIGAPATDNAV